MAAQKTGPAAPEVTPLAIQEREKALRTNPPKPSDRAFPALIIGATKHPKVFGEIKGEALSYEDRLALCAAVIVDAGDAIIPPKALDWRKTRAAHDLGDGRFAIVLTNDFVIEAVPSAPAVELAPEPAPKKKGKAD